MVAAGVFLVARFFPVFQGSSEAMNALVIIGSVTALLAATMGVVNNDIKKVLAYSTISQLGYMMAALGVGAHQVRKGAANVYTNQIHPGQIPLKKSKLICELVLIKIVHYNKRLSMINVAPSRVWPASTCDRQWSANKEGSNNRGA